MDKFTDLIDSQVLGIENAFANAQGEYERGLR